MTAGFATAVGHSRLCLWPEISETKMLGKRRNHRTTLRASRAIPANVLSVLLHVLGHDRHVEDQLFFCTGKKI